MLRYALGGVNRRPQPTSTAGLRPPYRVEACTLPPQRPHLRWSRMLRSSSRINSPTGVSANDRKGVFCQMIAIPGCVSLEKPDSAKGRPLPAVLPADSVQHQVWRREYFSSHMGVPQRLQHMNPLGALATLSMRPGSYAMRKCSTRSLGRSIPIPGVLGYLIAPFSTLKPCSWIALRRGDP